MLLTGLRRPSGGVASDRYLCNQEILWNVFPGRHYFSNRWSINFGLSKVNLPFAGRWLALDLDDTLLLGSFTCADDWGDLGGAGSGFVKGSMAVDWWASLRRWLRGSPELVPCKHRHPYLNHPLVEVAFRPALLEGLAELKALGLGLVLVTASARQRVDYLCLRFPFFGELFRGPLGHVITAEDMVELQLEAVQLADTIDDPASAAAHRLRPRSLAVKTPWAVSRACGIPSYDLLIDDSKTTAEVFDQAGLNDRLLYIEGRHPWSGYGVGILDAAVRRLLGEIPADGHGAPLPCLREWQEVPAGIPVPPKIEDPLYFPLLHYSDQF